jgi:hypothetical protein
MGNTPSFSLVRIIRIGELTGLADGIDHGIAVVELHVVR